MLHKVSSAFHSAWLYVRHHISANFVDWPHLQQYLALGTIAVIVLVLLAANRYDHLFKKWRAKLKKPPANSVQPVKGRVRLFESLTGTTAETGEEDIGNKVTVFLGKILDFIVTIVLFVWRKLLVPLMRVVLRPYVALTVLAVTMYLVCGIGALHERQTAAAIKHFTDTLGEVTHVNTSTKTLVQMTPFNEPDGSQDKCPVVRYWSADADYQNFTISPIGKPVWTAMLFDSSNTAQIVHVCYMNKDAAKTAQAASK
jgi:hypothetical protein